MVLVPCLRVSRPFHIILPLHILLPHTVQHHVRVDIATVIVSVRVCDQQHLMPGEKTFGELFRKRMCLLRRQSMFCHILRRKAQNVMMSLHIFFPLILLETTVQLCTLRIERKWITVESRLNTPTARSTYA